MQTRSKIILLAVCIAVIALLARTYLGKNREPDKIQIQDQLLAAVMAANNKDAHEVMSVISDNYTDDNDSNPERLNLLLRKGMSEVSDLNVQVAPAAITVKGDTAHSSSYITIKTDGQIILSQVLELEWQKESTRRYFIVPDQTWRIVRSNYSGEYD